MRKLQPGTRFGRLVLIATVPNTGGKSKHVKWLCQCDCGNTSTPSNANLLAGATNSCGCLREELRPTLRRTHGESHKSPEYRVWCHMRARCECQTDNNYGCYGARGIKVCDRWQVFINFLQDMGRRPSPKHTIDRVRVNGDYEPGNCRWAVSKVQNNNRRNNRRILYNGKVLTLAQWADASGIAQGTLTYRLRRGWSMRDALTRPIGPNAGKKVAA